MRIGNLNGPWSIMFRLALASYPVAMTIIIGWGTWVTSNVFGLLGQQATGVRFTATDAAAMEARLTERINSSPSDEWKARVIAAERFQSEVLNRLIRIETKLERP